MYNHRKKNGKNNTDPYEAMKDSIASVVHDTATMDTPDITFDVTPADKNTIQTSDSKTIAPIDNILCAELTPKESLKSQIVVSEEKLREIISSEVLLALTKFHASHTSQTTKPQETTFLGLATKLPQSLPLSTLQPSNTNNLSTNNLGGPAITINHAAKK
jgi:hypothetical protein